MQFPTLHQPSNHPRFNRQSCCKPGTASDAILARRADFVRKILDMPDFHAVGDKTTQELGDEIACPSVHIGGGAAAAAAASLGAASAELVVTLSLRRKRPPEEKAILQNQLRTLRDLREKLLVAADADAAALVELMHHYKDGTGDERELLYKAAGSVLEIARLSAEVARIASDAAQYATRFTVSDVGAAAAIARGAVSAALMTVEINVELLTESDDRETTTTRLQKMRDAIETIDRLSEAAAVGAITTTRRRVAGDSGIKT